MDEINDNLVDKNFVTCPCCGKKTMPKMVQVEPSIIETFMACVLAGQPFTNTYKLYNGKITIVCREPTRAETFLLSDIAANVPAIQDQKLRLSVSNLMFYISGIYPVKQIIVESSDPDKDNSTFQVRDVCNKIVDAMKCIPNITEEKVAELKNVISDPKNISMLPHQILSQVVSTHNTITKNLYSAGFDNVFYTGIPHVE